MDDDDVLGWKNAKSTNKDSETISVDENVENAKNIENKKNDEVNNILKGNEKVQKRGLEKKQGKDLEEESKLGIISLIVIAILLFIVGILIGRKLLKIDEKTVSSYTPKTISEKNDNKDLNIIQNNIKLEEKNEEEIDQEEIPIFYARYNIKNPNDNNKECSVSFGKANNFSFSLGKNDAYIYGEYHIDGKIITCNAITWRNVEKQESINSTIKFIINEKNEVEVSDVNIFEGNSGMDSDKELINLDGLRVGTKYEL